MDNATKGKPRRYVGISQEPIYLKQNGRKLWNGIHLPLHLETPTSATSPSTTTTPSVCSHRWAGLGRAVCHYIEQEPVTFTKYTRYTGRAGEGVRHKQTMICLSL